jgi:hypothetical protein
MLKELQEPKSLVSHSVALSGGFVTAALISVLSGGGCTGILAFEQCNVDEDCAEGQVCNDDLICEPDAATATATATATRRRPATATATATATESNPAS